MRRLTGGDRAAWVEFVERFSPVVTSRICQVLAQCGTGNPASECDDVVAEVFASLLANQMAALRGFQHRSSLATWLTIIAHRTSLRAASKQRRAKTRDAHRANGFLQAETPAADNPLARLLAEESRSSVQEKLALLKAADRQVIELFHFENLGYREIAFRMGLAANSVGPRLHRAQQRLKRLLEEAA